MDFSGTFTPPAIGKSIKPFGISGPGQISIADQGFRVSGFRPSGTTALLAFLAFVAMIAVAIVMSLLKVGWLIMSLVAGAMGALILAPAIKGRGRHNPKKPVEVTLSWESMEDVDVDYNSDVFQIRVKLPEGKRCIYFKPGGRADALLRALKRIP